VEHLEDLYDIVGVPPDATAEELHHARNRMLRYWHPDRSLDPLAPERAKRINAAYDVLADPARRAVYDQHRAARLARLEPPPATPPSQPATPPSQPAPAAPAATATQAGPSWTETPWNPGPLPATASATGGPPPAPPGPAPGPFGTRPHRELQQSGLEEAQLSGLEVFSWPDGQGELWERGRRALPFAGVALLVWVTAPPVSMLVPVWLLTLWIFTSLFAVSAAVRALARRPLPFRRQGWERFGAAWLVGSVAFVLAWQIVISPLGDDAAFAIVYVVLLAAFLAGFGVVYLAWRR
jgi:hypothetical protein